MLLDNPIHPFHDAHHRYFQLHKQQGYRSEGPFE
jgi:hypothetical protein